MHTTRTRHHTPTTRVLAAVSALAAVVLMGCTPQTPPEAGTVTCRSASGQMSITPGVVLDARSNRFTLTGPSPTTSCVDRTGAGVTSARVDDLSILFPSLGCVVPEGTSGDGTATVRWSDGSTSSLELVATLDSAYGGDITSTITSGRFAGGTASARFLATPTEGSCLEDGITAESVEIGNIIVRP